MSDIQEHDQIAFVGFGEAAEAFSKGWGRDIASTVRAYDIKQETPGADGMPAARAAATGIALGETRKAAITDADAVFCLVTADRAVAAAEECASSLKQGAFWFDGNSCSPGSKRRAAQVIESAGGRYVDVAIMSPVYPKMHLTPLLLAGPHADAGRVVLDGLGMAAQISGPEVGDASSIKMIRSIMIKGMEALTAECLLAARRAGVDERVLASLTGSNPEIDWPKQGAYNLERMMVHGRRRAAEMREVAATLDELGLPNGLAQATADWQQRIGDLTLAAGDDAFSQRADAILQAL